MIGRIGCSDLLEQSSDSAGLVVREESRARKTGTGTYNRILD
jgi:hypothetical protein